MATSESATNASLSCRNRVAQPQLLHHLPDQRADALLRLQEASVDVTVPEGAFAQTPRPGLKIEELTCEP